MKKTKSPPPKQPISSKEFDEKFDRGEDISDYLDLENAKVVSKKAMKLVTKRHGKADPVEDAKILLRTVNRLKGKPLIPKGVYRFKSFEEADEWMLRQIAATHARLNSKTS